VLGVTAVAIETLQLVGELGGAGSVTGAEQFNDVGGNVHAAGGVDAGREAEGDIEAGDRLGCRIELGCGEECAEACSDRLAQFAQAQGGDHAILATERNGIGDGGDGGHFEETWEQLVSGAMGVVTLEQGLREFERDGRAAERFLGIAAVVLIGIEDGQRNWNSIV
jgi:hypothetical protein